MRRRDARLDRDIAALLAARAFMEIRYLAEDVRRRSEDNCADEDLERIRFLADVCHNLPGIARPVPGGRRAEEPPAAVFSRRWPSGQ